jgi:hypothetical protein
VVVVVVVVAAAAAAAVRVAGPGAVEDGAEDPAPDPLELVTELADVSALRPCRVRDHQHAVDQRRERERVGHGQDGRAVEDDEVERVPLALEEVAHRRRVEQRRLAR